MGVGAETLAVMQAVERRGNVELTRCGLVGSVLIWPVAPASSRHWSRQDGGATTNSRRYQLVDALDLPLTEW